MNNEEQTTQAAAPPREPSQYQVAMQIADQLGETQFGPRTSIRNIVRALGRTQSLALLEETQRIEADGGLPVPDGSRRRTPGGVFFHLVYTTGKPKEGRTLEKPASQKKPKAKQPKPPEQIQPASAQPAQPPVPAFPENDRLSVIDELAGEKGIATTVKITLIGRPGNVLDRGQCIVTTMASTKVPALPKGIPAPAEGATNYVVYIATKQWKKVAESIADPEDALIIEGFPQLDAKTSSIAVFASNVTTKNQQKAKKAPPPAAVEAKS